MCICIYVHTQKDKMYYNDEIAKFLSALLVKIKPRQIQQKGNLILFDIK